MSDWAEKSNALVAKYSAAEDIDEAILNMGEKINRLRAERDTVIADLNKVLAENATLRELVREAQEYAVLPQSQARKWSERAEKALS